MGYIHDQPTPSAAYSQLSSLSAISLARLASLGYGPYGTWWHRRIGQLHEIAPSFVHQGPRWDGVFFFLTTRP